MKVDTSKLKKASSDISPECRLLIEKMTKCLTRAENLEFLKDIRVWVYGKCELYHWIEILDRFDKILEEAARHVDGNEFVLYCDNSFSDEDIRLLLCVLNFTTLLIEHSFSRHLYNSIEHLTQLISSQNMDIALAVLNLLYMFSKRSNFIPRLPLIKKELLIIKLLNIAERWGDPNYGLALIDCCIKNPKGEFLYQLFIDDIAAGGNISLLEIPDLMEVFKSLSSSEVIKLIYEQFPNPSVAVKMQILHRARLIAGFNDRNIRLQFVQARLQAVSVLIYSNALQENSDRILYPGFGEELCELIDKEDNYLIDIRAAVLRTLTSMLHYDRNHNIPKPGSRLPKIIHYTGAERQVGILPLLVRDCISSLTGLGTISKYPITLATSLFSLLYHLASYEAGGQALVRSGMMQSLICVINWAGVDLEHITFVTRAVRVIDLITNIDIAKFHQNNGLNAFVQRLEKEIDNCRDEIASASIPTHSYIKINDAALYENTSQLPVETMQEDVSTTVPASNQIYRSESNLLDGSFLESPHDIAIKSSIKGLSHNNFKSELPTCNILDRNPPNSFYPLSPKDRNLKQTRIQYTKKTTCVTQRAALLKSMLNFLKKCIQDHAHYNGMRNIMESSLPCSLRHIISMAEYYGPSLFLLATDVITVHIFNEPSILSSLQDSGITNAMLKSLLQKGVPATREVLGSLPNIFSALCLNERGLIEFMSFEPFDKLLKVLISPDYLVAMRRRRSSDPLGDTATNLGNAMDDLIKHHPYLRTDASEAIVRLLNELVRLGSDPNYICWRANKDASYSLNRNNCHVNTSPQYQNITSSNNISRDKNNENDTSEEEEYDNEEIASTSQQQQLGHNRLVVAPKAQHIRNSQKREAIPLIDYIINVMKFIEAILSNSSNGEHCRQLVIHDGLKPLLQLLSLPNLPVDSPVSLTAQAVANVCKSIINLTQETKVIDTALEQLSQIVGELQPLIKHVNLPGGSVLLYELLTCPKLEDGFSNADYTPLLHNMSSVHGYVVMLVHICRNASAEMRTILLQRWGFNSSSGIQLLQNLVQLYISLVWESTVLLSFCSEEPVFQSSDCWDEILRVHSLEDFKLHDKISQCVYKNHQEIPSKTKKTPEEQLRFIKSLLAASSRLGRALAELFGTLVKLSVGSPLSRQRRNNDFLSNFTNSKFPSSDAKKIARVLSSILVNGFRHEHFLPTPVPKLRLTFLICSVGFTGPMLFDDKRSCFHLMVSQFCEENGLNAFFDMFNWALSIESEQINSHHSYKNCGNIRTSLNDHVNDEADFPEGTGEFLDAWLQLLEKMVNPRAILDSPYALETARQPQSSRIINFEPVFYLTEVHQLAMLAIQRIWKRKPIQNYGVSMTETIMTILKHLIKSNTMLSERFQSRMHETLIESKIPGESKKSLQIPGNEKCVNADHLRILTDMGFFRLHVLEALHNTNTLEQATDFLLNHPEACSTASRESDSIVLNESNHVSQMDIDISAILSASSSKFEITSKEKEDVLQPNKTTFIKPKPFSKETFNLFCADTLERTFSYMEILPETVNTGADLLSVIYRRQNLLGRQKFILSMVNNFTDCMNNVFLNIDANKLFDYKKQKDIVTGITATKLNIRLKVLFLLLDEMYSDVRKELCIALCKEQCLNLMIILLNKSKLTLENQIATGIKPTTPCWLQSLVDLLDAIDSVCTILQRKANMRAVCSDIWKWYDTSTGKWNLYSETNNAIIKNAFKTGERSIIINIGRQRYTINFNCMTQVSEASGSHRPVMPGLKITEAIAMYYQNSNQKVENVLTQKTKSDGDVQNINAEILSHSSMLNFYNDGGNWMGVEVQNDDIGKEEDRSQESKDSKDHKTTTNMMETNRKPRETQQKIELDEETTGLSKYKTEDLIECIVCLLNPNLSLNFETKLSLLKLCARLTKDFQNAKVFVQLGGVQILLKMNQSCSLMGFPTYVIIIIRHVLETPKVLQEAIERILSARTIQSIPVGHRDLIYILTQVSSAVARDPQIFLAASMKILRGDYSANTTLSIDDSKFVVKSKTFNIYNDGLASNLNNTEIISPDNHVSVEVIKDLLYAIVQPCCHYGGQQLRNADAGIKRDQPKSEAEPGLNDCLLSSSGSIQPEVGFDPCCCSWHVPTSGHNHNKPVLPRATIIKILADAVRSYQSLVPCIIIEHSYSTSDSLLIDKQQSCLAFIIDNFLPIISCQQNAEVSIMSRALITSLADCYGNTSVQNKVAEEIHEGIIRTLLLPESSEKHTRLQVLIGLLPSMIESPMLANKIQVQRNNMYRILLHQGIMTDLCKIAQYIDLCNSFAYPTIFSILRPLEILLRLTVAPGALSAKRFLFGNSSQSVNSTLNRRYYPRLTSGSNVSSGSANLSGDNVLRDIIRNVLCDRRHGFEFMFNPDDFVIDSEESSNTVGISVDDEGNENRQNTPISSTNTHSSGRSQLSFNRLLDDFMQNERNFESLRNNNHHSNNISTDHTGITVTDHIRNSSNNSEFGNNDNGESDGASSSSEAAAVTIDNITMADVSTSDSDDSNSNASTEHENRNHEEDEDDDENHGIEEGPDDPSETEPDDETRQFIEVFNHIYDRESSQTASNFADIDADDEASEGGINVAGDAQPRNTEANFEEAIASFEEQDLNQSTDVLSDQPAVSFINTSAELNSNIHSNLQLERNETIVPITSSWIAPRTAYIDSNITNENIDVSSNISVERVLTAQSTNDNSNNNIITENASTPRILTSTDSHNTGPNMQIRDSTRRLIFLDQQYCAQMPSFSNPTEEGQLELFNQDALHWWLEEAKHLDFESQTNACLYVGHLLIPFLANELKAEHSIHKKDHCNGGLNIPSSSCRRSAIPVPIQQSSTTTASTTTGVIALNNLTQVIGEITDNYIQETSSPGLPQTLTMHTPLGLDPQNVNMVPMRELDTNIEINPQLVVFDALNQIRQTSSNDIPQSNLNVSNNTLNESLERSSINQYIHENQGGNNIISDEGLFGDEEFENEEHEDEMNSRTYLEDEELDPALNVNLENAIQNSLLQTISENVGHVALNSVSNNEISEHISNTESLPGSFSLEEHEVLSSVTSDSCVGDPGINSETSVVFSHRTDTQEITPEVRSVLGSLEIPEGVDPSFLAALPEEMREEVIQEHLRMQRVRHRDQQNATELPQDSLLEVNPEFLAALPPNIQSEVLMQQRIEQQRQVAQTTNPEDPVDAASFFQNLPDSLRQAILTDMDESQIASLPPELAAEAQFLRSDWESRNISHDNNQTNTLTSSSRGGYLAARFPSSSSSTQDARWQNSIWYDTNGTPQTQRHHHTTIIHHHAQIHEQPIALLLMEDENNLLDPDSLTTLLLFLFIEDSKMNFSRLHRIVRNLCYHVPIREWIIHALIGIIQRINHEETSHFKKSMNPQWLKYRLDAFGFKSNIFIINKIGQECKSTRNSESFSKSCTININPQATQMIIRNCLDMLFVLAKHFPRSFIPFNIENKVSVDNNETKSNFSISKNNGNFMPSTVELNSLTESKQYFDEFPSTSKEATATRTIKKNNTKLKTNTFEEFEYNTNARSFWDVLLNLDMNARYRSSNLHAFPLKVNPSWEWKKKRNNFLSFSDSPFTKLLEMLPFKDICRSPQLTDMLLKLLASLSINLPKEKDQFVMSVDLKKKQETDNAFSSFQHENRKGAPDKPLKLKKSNCTIYSKNLSQLKLVVEILTHQSSTSEGLDDVAKLINNLSLCSEVYNAIFLHYLKTAIYGLAKEVQKSIQNLLDELRHVNYFTNENASSSTSKNAQKHILQNCFTSESISTQTNIKSLFQFQLPAMKKLLSTSSAQPFFLRTLKIFIQVREFYSNQELNHTSLSALTNKQSLSQIITLDSLWNTLSACLFELEESKDEYAVLVLQPIVEAFFLIYGSQKTQSKKNFNVHRSAHGNNSSEYPSTGTQMLMESETTNKNCLDTEKENLFSTENTKNINKNYRHSEKAAQIKCDRLMFISFAEKHRVLLNQILRQSPIHLSDGPFAVLVAHTRILDFDVKRKYFQTELERIDEGVRREENTVSVRRVTVFEDSFRVLYRLGSEEWKNRFYIVFEDEEGQDAGGLLREWYVIISREIFNPMYALFCVSPGDRVTYMINPSSYANPNHLSYFKFVGRVIAKAIHDNKLLECYFTRSFYKHILGKQVKYTDMESQDYEFYKGLDYLMKNNVSTLGYELTFSTEVQEFGVTQVRDLIPNGRDIIVTEDNKFDYVQLVCQLKMSGSIRQQLDAFLEGFYDIIPKHLISIFNEQELELLISGLPDIDIEDLKINTEYHKYTAKSNQIQWFWRALRSFDQADRAKFLQFVTGTSKVPLQGFRSLEGMNGIQKLQIHRDERSTDRLPCAHTCFNQLDLPMYESYDKLRTCLLKAIHECSEGFGFA